MLWQIGFVEVVPVAVPSNTRSDPRVATCVVVLPANPISEVISATPLFVESSDTVRAAAKSPSRLTVMVLKESPSSGA